MKKYFLIFIFIIAFSPLGRSAEIADYEASAAALTKAVAKFRNLSAPRPAFDVVLHRDPFRPLVDGNGGLVSRNGLHEGLVVQGIIFSDKGKEVLVEDKFYKEGDTVGPYKIIKIERDGFTAELIENSTQQYIPLYPENGSSAVIQSAARKSAPPPAVSHTPKA